MTSRRQRAVLARLLIEPGSTVSVDALVAAVWEGEPAPQNARSALHAQISRLRSLLGSAGGQVITHPPGYRLDVPATAVDAHRFENSVRECRDLMRWAPQAALTSLDQALALWRGRAYAEFADTFGAAEAVRLEQLRLQALEERISALVAIGEWGEAVAQSEGLIATEPFRERPYALAMRALANGGRRGEALALYQRLRGVLTEGLGSEPSVEVQALHVEILREAEVQARPWSASEQAPPAVRPGTAPVPVSAFFGRVDELQTISEALSRSRLVTLVGPGGVGKTRLTMEWTGRLATDQQVAWVELASLADPAAVASVFLNALDIPNPPRITPQDALITALHTRSIVLIVDNCEHVIEAVAQILAAIARFCPRVRVVATSRERLAVDGEHVLVLQPLPVPDRYDPAATESPSVRLFLDRLQAAGSPVDERDPAVTDLVTTICRRLDGLPLAIELTAAQTASLGLPAVATATDLLGLASGRRSERASHRNLRATLDWSFERLDPDEQRLLCRLAVFPSRFPLSWAVGVCADGDLTPEMILPLLARLVEKSLVRTDRQSHGERRHHMLLRVIRQYAEERLDAAGEANQFRQEYARFVVSWTEERAARLGLADDSEFIELSDATHDLRTAHAWARRHDPDLALRLSAALWLHTELRGDNEVRGWAEAASHLPGSDGHPMRPVVLAIAAMGSAARGAVESAGRLIAEALRTADPDHEMTPFIWWDYGMMLLLAGDLAESMRALHRGWRLARRVGNRWGETVTAAGMTSVLVNMAQPTGSQRWLHRTSAVIASLPGPSARATAELVAGETKTLVDPVSALASFKRCHALASPIGARFLVTLARSGMASVAANLSAGRERIIHWADAVRYWQDVGDQFRVWIHLRFMITLYSDEGEDELAVALDSAVATSPARDSPGVDSERLRQAVDRSEGRLGDLAREIRLRWTGAPVGDVVDLIYRDVGDVKVSDDDLGL
ncbi:BTAD domain-containing putative transcriptional regulator [Solwaraspora sp. WMMD1047]|uniref:BTAD domain-containing putative transcriptional regulator n=1 Tax=Solwaraspora sp. WMMD1047 TaxID=3016102 RepID=UPI002415E25B|nr:BTAD domain-containing putative transcriptional regulator [Solwaraspora sp. WMMD1047]MDG4831507.1 BTAD domain-containing putative transcriptional regulator [Solwaraspora sp. WMMD1047]